MMVPYSHIMAISFVLFAIGLTGIFTRRDAITVFLAVEIILNAANLAFVGTAYVFGDAVGQVVALVVIAVAAAEAAIGLSIVIRLKRAGKSLNLSLLGTLKG